VSRVVGFQPDVKRIVSYTRTQINRSTVQGLSLLHNHSASQHIPIHNRIHKNSSLVPLLSQDLSLLAYVLK
jgi:hypothetical protein